MVKITRIKIENFRSIKYLEFKPTPRLNAFIGPNSSGKSNVLKAITFLLGESYPTINSLKDKDFFKGDKENDILIEIEFDSDDILRFSKNNDGSYSLRLNDRYCRGEDREKFKVAYIGVEREINDFLPASRWSLLGRFLKKADNLLKKDENKVRELKEKLDKIRDDILLSVKDENKEKIVENFIAVLKEEAMNQLNLKGKNINIDFNLYDPWNLYRTFQIIIEDPDTEIKLTPADMGMGLQSSLSVAILRAYSELHLTNEPPIVIDEPELFLHPNAQRNFYNILKKLSESGVQIFYTTHSPNFISLDRFNEIFLVKKNVNGTYIKNADPQKFVIDLMNRRRIETTEEELMLYYKNAYENTGDSKSANEAFFANKIILVEGQSEALLLPFMFEKKGFDYIREGITIVACGGKQELDRFLRLYSEFGITCYVIFDGDKQIEDDHRRSENEKEKNRRINKELLALLDPRYENDYPDDTPKNKYLGFKYCFERNLGFETNKKGLDLFLEFKSKFERSEIQIPSWIDSLIEKVKNLPDETESILILKEE